MENMFQHEQRTSSLIVRACQRRLDLRQDDYVKSMMHHSKSESKVRDMTAI